MADYQRLVQEIQSRIGASGDADREQMARLAENYTAACEAVNERLSRCARFLRQRNLGEAIRLAEMSPNLLETFAVLDFPARETFERRLADLKIPSGPPLAHDTVRDLDDAYSEEWTRQHSFREFRRVSLARAPLRDRLNVLRTIAAADSDPVWREDIETFETARLREIHNEITQAIRRADMETLTVLEREIIAPDWTTPPPQQLVSVIRAARLKGRREQVLFQMSAVAESLHEGFSQFDRDTALAARDEWNRFVAELGSAPADLVESVQPALRWLAETDCLEKLEKHFASACNDLEEGTEEILNVDELDVLYNRANMLAEQLHVNLSPALVEAYHRRKHILQLRRTRQRRTIMGAVGLICFLVACGVVWVIVLRKHEAAVVAAVDGLAQLQHLEKYDTALEFLANLEKTTPSVAADSRVETVRVELQSAIETERHRCAAFAEALSLAQQTFEKGSNDVNSIEKLRGDAKTDREKLAVLELQQRLNERLRDVQREADEQFKSVLQEVMKECERLDPNRLPITSGVSERIDELEVLQSRLKTLREDKRVTESLRRQVDPLITRVGQWTTRIQKESAARRQLEDTTRQLTSGMGDPAGFAKTLVAYSEFDSESVLGREFAEVAKELPLWQQIEAWNKFADDWNGILDAIRLSRKDPSAETVASLLARAQAATEEFAWNPACVRVKQMEPFFHSIGQRSVASEEGSVDDLRKLLQVMRDIDAVGVIETTNGEWYYLAAPHESMPDGRYLLKYIHSFNKSTRQGVLPLSEVKRTGTQTGHLGLTDRLFKAMETLSVTNWRDPCWQMIDACWSAEDLDPLLKVMILQTTLEVACRGDYCLHEGFRSVRDAMRAADVDVYVNWLDPKENNTRDARHSATSLLASLPDRNESIRKSAEVYAACLQNTLARCEWIGWLQEEGGNWTCVIDECPPGDGELCTALPATGQEGLRLQSVGRIRAATCRIYTSNAGLLMRGRPVYLVREVMKTPEGQ